MKLPPAALMALCLLAGCVPHWVNPQITDPAEAKRRLATDNSYCRKIEDMFEDRVNIQDRISFDPSPVGQMANYYHNYMTDQNRVNLYEKCMRGRGWTRSTP